MDDLWQQFHRLPKAIRDAAATNQALAAVEKIEQANSGLDLANFVMRLMVKEFAIKDLAQKLQDEANLSNDKSRAVSQQLQTEALAGVAEYLGIGPAQTSPVVPPKPANKRPLGAAPVNLPTKPADLPSIKTGFPISYPPAPAPPPPSIKPTLPKPPPPPISVPLGQPRVIQQPIQPATPQPGKPGLMGLPTAATGPLGLGQLGTVPTPLRPIAAPPTPVPVTPVKPNQLPTPHVLSPLDGLPKMVKPVVMPKPGLSTIQTVPLGHGPQSRPGLGQVAQPVTPAPVFPAKSIPGLPQISNLSMMPPVPAMAEPAKSVNAIAPPQEYSEEDTREIEKQTARVKTLQTASEVSDFDELAKHILDQHHLAWPEELMTRRAQAIAKARLKEIRNSQQTQVMLTQEPKIGGLGLDPDLAKQLVSRLETEANRLKARGMVRPPAPIQPPPPVVPPPIQAAKPLGQPPLTRVIPPAGLPPGQLPPANITEPPRPSRPIKRPADIPAPIMSSGAVHIPVPEPVRPTVMQRPRQADRPTVSDITRPTKTYGPGEEMRSLTLTEWRRLGQGAAESARVILEKFKHLQRESFALWTAALAGWRQSEVHLLYLDMGRQSLEQGVSIQEVIGARAKSGQTYLSEHEFFTMTDLNRMLQH